MRKHPFIVLEGIDGTGKTSAAARLAEMIGGDVYKTPPASISSLRSFYDSCGSIDARYAYYLSGVLLASAKITELIDSRPVVCDRYIYSTIAYHAAMGYTPRWINHEELPIEQPDYIFCLVASEAIIRERLATRDGQSSLVNRAAKAVFMNRVAESLKSLATHVLDTSLLNEIQVGYELNAILHKG